MALAEGEPVHLTFALWDENQQPGQVALAEAYMAEHPNVTIEVQLTPWDQYWMKLEAAATGGGMPDVFRIHANTFMMYADAGFLLPLDFEYDYSPYPQGLVGMYNYGGVQYAIPIDYDTIGLAYNKELFDAKGIPYPDDTWDWAKLREVAIALTDAEAGVYGFAVPNDAQSGYDNFINQNGGFTFDPATRTSGYNLPETIEALQFYIDLMNVDKVSPSLESLVDMDVNTYFQSGKLAMAMVGSWNMSTFTNNADFNGKFDIAVLPMGTERASIYNGLGWAGAGNTAHPEVVKDFIAFLGSEEANIIYGQTKSAIPAYKGTETYFTDQFDFNIAAYTEMLEYGVQWAYDKTKSQWDNYAIETIREAYLGNMTVEEACLDIHEYVTECVEDDM
jgi:multiple sugar transport system substrate-binding protein